MSVICFLPFLCNPSYLLYISTSVWAVRKTVLSSRIFLVVLKCWRDTLLKPETKYSWILLSLLSCLTFLPSLFFPSWFCVAFPLQCLSMASSCIISEVHSHKTWDVPPLGWTWVLMVPEQKSWSTYFYVYGCQLAVTCQGLMQTRRQCFGKAFWPAHLHSSGVFFFTLVREFLKWQRGKKKVSAREEKEESQKKKHPAKETWMLPQECFESEFSLIWAAFCERHCMTTAIRHGTDCPSLCLFPVSLL